MSNPGGLTKISKPEAVYIHGRHIHICQKTELKSRWTVPLSDITEQETHITIFCPKWILSLKDYSTCVSVSFGMK